MLGFIKVLTLDDEIEFHNVQNIRSIRVENDTTVIVDDDHEAHAVKTNIEAIDQQLLNNQMDVAECFAKHLNRR